VKGILGLWGHAKYSFLLFITGLALSFGSYIASRNNLIVAKTIGATIPTS
jgi:hypothetical protein